MQSLKTSPGNWRRFRATSRCRPTTMTARRPYREKAAMIPDEVRPMNGTGSLTQRAWVEAARAHSRLDTFEAVYVEQQATIRRDISNVQTDVRSEEHTSELQSLMRISYA